MYNYQTYLIFESTSRDKKIEKQKEKIRKFLKYEPLIDYIFDKVVGVNSTKGLQYTIWFADKSLIEFSDILAHSYTLWKDVVYMEKLNAKERSKLFETYFRTGKIEIDLELDDEWGEPKSIPKEEENKIRETIDKSLKWVNTTLGSSITLINDWLKSPLREEEIVDLSQYKTLKEAEIKAEEWHKNIKATGVVVNEKGNVIMTFPDGYYWIDLETNSCEDEGSAMGHCATTNHDTLYSLRKKQSPHVTVAIGKWSENTKDPDNSSTIYQMKGRGNKKPLEKYHPYIVELLAFPNVSNSVKLNKIYDEEYVNPKQWKFAMYPIENIEGEYNPEDDFHISDLSSKRIKYLYDKNPTLMKNQINFAIENKLMKEGELSKEEFVKNYKDLELIGGNIHFILDDWADFDKTIFKDHSSRNGGWQESVLNYTAIDNWYYDENFDYNSDWAYVEERAFKVIMEKCAKEEIYYDVIGGENEKSFILSKENMKINEKKDDITITTPEGFEISFKSLIEGHSSNKKIEYWHNDNLEGIRSALNSAKNMSQAYADENKAYEVVTDAIGDKLGGIAKNDENKHGAWNDGIHFWIDLDYISEIENRNSSGEKNKTVLDIINTLGYDSDGYDDDDNELLIECDEPYYGWDGEISPDTFSEELINKLYDI